MILLENIDVRGLACRWEEFGDTRDRMKIQNAIQCVWKRTGKEAMSCERPAPRQELLPTCSAEV